MVKMHDLDWLFSIGIIFFLISIWGIGANDVANSYATSVSSKSLTLVQAGVLATITEFVGAIALGQQVTSTIRSGVFSITLFENSPGVLLMANVVAEIGSATWLTICTRLGFPVSTTQSIVGALVGVGIAADIHVNWGWKEARSHKSQRRGLLVHSRADPMEWALRFIPLYYALTAGILALFVVISGGHGIPTLEGVGVGQATGIILGVFFGVLIITAVFFVPYFHAKLIKQDHRLRFWHIPMGPLLWKENYSLYLLGSGETALVPDYYGSGYKADDSDSEDIKRDVSRLQEGSEKGSDRSKDTETQEGITGPERRQANLDRKRNKELEAVDKLPWAHPKRIYAIAKLVLTYGITRDVIAHQSRGLEDVHRRAIVYDNKVEDLWTTAQVCSAMIMSVAHGANDISNAIGSFTIEYGTWSTGVTSATTDTPIWIKAVGGLGLGIGFWTFGYHIMRNLGNRITKHSPTRGYSMELGAAITVLLASRLGLPVSTTQCITGAIVGVVLVNRDLKSLNWKQLGKIFLGWVLTVPAAALVSGIIIGMALNVLRWGAR